MEVVLVMALACGAMGLFVDGFRGMMFGALLGPVGLIVVAILAGKKG